MNRLLCVWLLLTATAVGQATSGFHRVNQVITRSNSGTYAQVVPGATIYVQLTSSGVAATIYSDPNLTLTIPGAKVTSDFSGNYSYYLPLNTCVTENISSPSQGSLVVPNICGNAGLSLPISALNGGTGTTTAPISGQILVGVLAGNSYFPQTMIGDCTLVYTGSITCLKTNGVPFSAAATTAIGTSGAVIPLLSTANTWGQNQTISTGSTTSTILGLYNTTAKNWQLVSEGSAASDAGNFDLYDSTDSITVLSFSNTTGTLFGSQICTTANGACATGSGTVTSFAAPSGSWPTWLVPTVTNSTTTPSLAVAASAIPNSALANSVVTINGQTCTLGGSCSVSGTSRTCNSNGCYVIAADGTIVQWGLSATCGSAGQPGCTVTFPYPFTTTAHISVTATVYCTRESNLSTVLSSFTTTGFNAASNGVVNVGGSGSSYSGGCAYSWQATGN